MSEKNGIRQTGVKRPGQKVVKELVAKTAPAAGRLNKAKRLGKTSEKRKPMLAAGDLEGEKETEESVPAANMSLFWSYYW